MMQFAQTMASTYGSNLKELIYTPLGFSIKNGQRVAPYAQGSHYNHVHVAYAKGPGQPAFFTNEKDAISWEKKHLGNGVESITTNTSELAFGLDWMPWNWGKTVDKERKGKKNKLTNTNTQYEQMMRELYPERYRTSSLTGRSTESELAFGPDWMPWNWGKLVDQERKTNPLNRTNQMLEQMRKEGLPTGVRQISTNGMQTGRGSSVAAAPINITAPITINQQPGQSADELASIVALKIGEAVAQARSASVFV
jgi:hypothetical protein